MTRLDQWLVEQGHFSSRERAKRAVMAGLVRMNDQVADKPGVQVPRDADVMVLGDSEPFASRAGRKLDQALDHFGIEVADAICLDIGASTGGFTDCLLQRGARRVYAVDVGYGQLALELRRDSRVVVMERTNARRLTSGDLPEAVDRVVVDVSFISLLKIVPALRSLLAPEAILVTLVKPQFEAGRSQVGKGGIVRDEGVRRAVIEERVREIEELGFRKLGVLDCETHGRGGNREAMAAFRWRAAP